LAHEKGKVRADTNFIQAYILLAGQKHPKLMGQSYSEAWVEIWDDVKDVFANARLTGQATMKVVLLNFLDYLRTLIKSG
jgi:hypothetical protein